MEIFEDVSNPLDGLEDMLHGREWSFTRAHEDEIFVQISGRQCQYRMTFVWQEDHNAMQFFCEYDMSLPDKRQPMTAKALQAINERLWLGHFDIMEDTHTPCFRHTSLFRGSTHSSGADHIKDLIEIALNECERYDTVFLLLANSLYLDENLLELALCENEGRA